VTYRVSDNHFSKAMKLLKTCNHYDAHCISLATYRNTKNVMFNYCNLTINGNAPFTRLQGVKSQNIIQSK